MTSWIVSSCSSPFFILGHDLAASEEVCRSRRSPIDSIVSWPGLWELIFTLVFLALNAPQWAMRWIGNLLFMCIFTRWKTNIFQSLRQTGSCGGEWTTKGPFFETVLRARTCCGDRIQIMLVWNCKPIKYVQYSIEIAKDCEQVLVPHTHFASRWLNKFATEEIWSHR